MAWTIDSAHTSVEFSVRHMAITTVRGRFEKLSGSVDLAPDGTLTRMEGEIDAASINTREPQRDAHLKSADFLDVEHYPTISFRSTRIESVGARRYRVHGDLTIRGTTRPVTLEAESSEIIRDPFGNRRVGISAEGTIDRKDFGLTWNMVLEMGSLLVGDQVKIHIELEAVESAS